MKHILLLLFASLCWMGCSKKVFLKGTKDLGDKTVSIKPLGKGINTAAEELAPVISGDGQTLFFVRAHHPGNIGGLKSGQDIWMSKFDSTTKEWQTAVNIGDSVNNVHHNVACGTNEEGTVLYLSNVYLKGGEMKPGISRSEFKDGKWSFPKEVKVKGIKKIQGHFYFYIDPKEEILIISMHPRQHPEAFEEDLYVFFWDQKSKCFHKKRALPKVINQPAVYETAPFLTADRKRLYFTRFDSSANAHIFVAERSDIDNWKKWSAPVEVYKAFSDSAFHSDHFEAYLVLHSRKDKIDDYGFFASARPGVVQADSVKGVAPFRADIYEFEIKRQYTLTIETRDAKTKELLLTNLRLTDSLDKKFTEVGGSKRDSVHTFNKISMETILNNGFTAIANTGDSIYAETREPDIRFPNIDTYRIKKTIYLRRAYPYTLLVETRDKETKRLIFTRLELKDSKGKTYLPKEGGANAQLNERTYRLSLANILDNAFVAEVKAVDSSNYSRATESDIRFSGEDQTTLKKIVYLVPGPILTQGTSDKFSFTINFDFDSSKIRMKEARMLDATLEFIKANKVNFDLSGYTDAVGRESKNDALSSRRIESTLNYMAGRDAAIKNKLKKKTAFGEKVLVVKTAGPEERNRRVEISIYGNVNPEIRKAFLKRLDAIKKRW